MYPNFVTSLYKQYTTLAQADGSNKEIEKLGIKTDKEWPTEDTMDILPIINKSFEKDGIPSGFET